MWAIISGPDGSGKKVISEWFVRENFQNESLPIKQSKHEFFKEMLNAASYLATASRCADMMHNADVFTVRSFWENGEIFLPLARKFQQITAQEYETALECYESMKNWVTAPTCFIYCKIDLKNAMERSMLKGQPLDQDRLRTQIRLYDEFFEKLSGVPVLELNMNQPIDAALRDLDYSVQSVKSSRLDAQTVWRRTLF